MNKYAQTERSYVAHLAHQRLLAQRQIKHGWIVEVSAWILVTALLFGISYFVAKHR